jgi:hypothetical protein
MGDLADFTGKDIEFICIWLDTHSLGKLEINIFGK